MAVPPKPDEGLTSKALPEPLCKAINHVFASPLPGTILVGGTALAGYYAAHRESDDIDLFTTDTVAQTSAQQAVKSLTSLGARIDVEILNPTYFHAVAELHGHTFTIDIVQDAKLLRVGGFHTTPLGVNVADLETLLMMKTAALVSRCSEKDLYDTLWLTKNYNRPTTREWLALGHRFEGGLTAETLLAALLGATLKERSCAFAKKFGVSSAEVLKRIELFRNNLKTELAAHLESAAPDLATSKLVKALKKLR